MLKKYILIFGTLLGLPFFVSASDVQSIVVQAKGGTENVFALNAVSKITFSGTTLNVVKNDLSQSNYSISNVQKILFGLRSVSSVNERNNNKLKVYPNPAKDNLYIEGINKLENLLLYNLTGSELTVTYAQGSNWLKINIGRLPQGLYILKVNNQVIKFQKQ